MIQDYAWMRKRKREVLEEDESISETECEKQKGGYTGLPADFDLPTDTTGAFAFQSSKLKSLQW